MKTPGNHKHPEKQKPLKYSNEAELTQVYQNKPFNPVIKGMLTRELMAAKESMEASAPKPIIIEGVEYYYLPVSCG